MPHSLPLSRLSIRVLLREEVRKNTFDEATGVITYSPLRAEVAHELGAYYAKLFLGDNSPEFVKLPLGLRPAR